MTKPPIRDFRTKPCLWCGGIGRDAALAYSEPPLICTCPRGDRNV